MIKVDCSLKVIKTFKGLVTKMFVKLIILTNHSNIIDTINRSKKRKKPGKKLQYKTIKKIYIYIQNNFENFKTN